MAGPLYSTATEWAANAVTFNRGTAADLTAVGVYHSLNPNEVPEVASFVTVVSITDPNDPLAESGITFDADVLSRIGTKAAAHLALTAGDWQRFVLLQTANEDIIRKIDVLEVL